MPRPERLCFACGYDLTGVAPGRVCPECGRPAFDERDVLDGGALRDRQDSWCAHTIIAFVVLAFLALILATCAR